MSLVPEHFTGVTSGCDAHYLVWESHLSIFMLSNNRKGPGNEVVRFFVKKKSSW